VIAALLIAYLPGALAYRLPFWGRDQRAALDAGERVFWHIQISLAWSLTIVLAMAAVGEYRFDRLLITNAVICLLLVLLGRGSLLYHGAAARPSWTMALPLLLVLFGIFHFFPPAEYVIGGKDPGTYVNEGIQLAQRGAIVLHDPEVVDTPAMFRELFFPLHTTAIEYDASRFMGFFITNLQRGEVVGQFPHLFPASIAIGYGLHGLTGARQAVAWWTILGLLAVCFLGARLVGRPAAFAGALLLAMHPIVIWFSRYPNSEVVMLAIGFASLLALARSQQDGIGGLGAIAGVLMGLLLFLRIDAVLVIGAALVSIIVAAVADRRPIPRGFLVTLLMLAVPASRYLSNTMWPYSVRLTNFLSTVPTTTIAGAIVAGLIVLAIIFRFREHYGEHVRRVLPLAVALVLVAAAAYAWWWRGPSPEGTKGGLTDYDAYAFRTFGQLYLLPFGVLLAVAGFVLVAWRAFWRDPAFMLSFAAFSLFLFYKIQIIPEHFWMGRRFVTFILPGALLLAGAAAFAALGQSRPWRVARAIAGTALLVLLGQRYVAASMPLVHHVEYAGVIPALERLAGQFGDRDLVIVESRDAGSDMHILATPLAYIYARHVLVLPNVRPDKAALRAYLEFARSRYERVWFLGGGGTDLLSRQIGAVPIYEQQVRVPEYERTPWPVLPAAVRRKDLDYSLYQLTLDPPPPGPFDLDVGVRDDLYLLRFYAKEQTEGRTVRWTRGRSLVSVPGLRGSETELVLEMHDGGRPVAQGASPARVEVLFDDTPLGTIDVTPGFREYKLALPAPLVQQAAARDEPATITLLSTTWMPLTYLGGTDTRELGVMVDRIQIR
jgi:4-amino-4-deoxy-L-arabinose transferase-like glycosyltransferase